MIIVAGSMRSGSSLCSRTLQANGAFLGKLDELDWRVHMDPEGVWENLEFVQMNNRLLQSQNANVSYIDGIKRAFDMDWITIYNASGNRSNQLKKEAHELFSNFIHDGVSSDAKVTSFKDPRNCFTLGFWHLVAQEQGEPLRVIWCIRNPSESISSMQRVGYLKHENISCRDWNDLWIFYNQSVFNYLMSFGNKTPALIVDYNDWRTLGSEKVTESILDFAELSNGTLSVVYNSKLHRVHKSLDNKNLYEIVLNLPTYRFHTKRPGDTLNIV